MSLSRFLGITFPFKDSQDGFYLDLTKTSKEAVRSNLIHLLLTTKGNRLYKPNFGCNLMQFIFEQLDDITFENIKEEIITTVQNNLQGVNIDNIEVLTEDQSVTLNINFSYSEGAFIVRDIVRIAL